MDINGQYTMTNDEGYVLAHGVIVCDHGDRISVNGTTHRKDEITIESDGTVIILHASRVELTR